MGNFINFIGKKKICLILLFAVWLCVPTIAHAQVTIGSNQPPSRFSLLDLDATKQQKGLHNARLTDGERNELVNEESDDADKEAARGLLIFNTTSGRLEFWNGSTWVMVCATNISE